MTVIDHLAGTATADPAITLATALHDVRAFIYRFVRLSEAEATLIAAWTAMTHAVAVGAFDYVAYLHITSPLPECGKTRLLEVLTPLVARPWFTARVSAAVLMRKVDKDHPTLLLDESDTAFNSDEQYAESLRGLLNAGFHRDGVASVCIGQGANITAKDFSVFCPKAIAGIGSLPPTIASRSIPIAMKRRTKTERVEKWRHRRGWAAAGCLRDQLAAAIGAHVDQLTDATPTCPDGLADRAEDVLEPLFAVADAAGGDWPETVRAAAVALAGQAARAARESSQNLSLELLGDVRDVFDAHPAAAALATKAILDALHALDERPWGTWGKAEKPMTAHSLSRLLKGLGIVPAGQIWLDGRNVRAYRRATFEDAFARYLGSKVLEREIVNETEPESRKTEVLGADGLALRFSPETPDEHWRSHALALQTAPPAKDTDDVDPPMGISREAWARHHGGNGKPR